MRPAERSENCSSGSRFSSEIAFSQAISISHGSGGSSRRAAAASAPPADDLPHGAAGAGGDLLFQAGQHAPLLNGDLALVGDQVAGGELQQRGFTRPVAAHQGHPLAGFEPQAHAVQQGRVPVRKRNGVQGQQTHAGR